MRRSLWLSLGIVALAAIVVAVLRWQHQAGANLRTEIEALRERNKMVSRLRAENEQLVAEQLSPEQLAALRADRAALDRLRNEVQTVKERAEKKATVSTATIGADQPPAREPAITDEPIPAAKWKNAGRATAVAAAETALWAAAGGDVRELAETLWLEGNARAKAEAILTALPANEQAKYNSAQELIALLTAKDVPLVNARIILVKPRNPDEERLAAAGETRLVVLLNEKGQRTRAVSFLARADGGAWRIVVPERAVEKYAAELKGTSVTGAAK